MNVSISYFARETATHILLSVFRKPIFPSSLLRTRDKIIMSFSSLNIEIKLNFISQKKLKNIIPLKVIDAGHTDSSTRLVPSDFLFYQKHLPQICG